jgi:hypothetical protein
MGLAFGQAVSEHRRFSSRPAVWLITTGFVNERQCPIGYPPPHTTSASLVYPGCVTEATSRDDVQRCRGRAGGGSEMLGCVLVLNWV